YLDYEQSLRHLDIALVAAPNDADFWELKGLITRRAGRIADSIAAFDHALLLDPLNVEALIVDALLLGRTGAFARSEELIARARAIGGAPVTLNAVAASVRFFQGDAEGAWALLKNDRSSENQDSRLGFAIATRGAANIRFAIRDWPVAARRPAS